MTSPGIHSAPLNARCDRDHYRQSKIILPSVLIVQQTPPPRAGDVIWMMIVISNKPRRTYGWLTKTTKLFGCLEWLYKDLRSSELVMFHECCALICVKGASYLINKWCEMIVLLFSVKFLVIEKLYFVVYIEQLNLIFYCSGY